MCQCLLSPSKLPYESVYIYPRDGSHIEEIFEPHVNLAHAKGLNPVPSLTS
jgi:hypothetical protein